jgi:Type I phosphodiesterase / nucleotide pyrophosphatase
VGAPADRSATARPLPRAEEVARLIAPAGPLAVPIPAYGGRSLPNLTSSVVRALGHEPPAGALAPLDERLDPFGGRRAEGPIVLFVVDGLGYGRLAAAARSRGGPLESVWLAHASPITSVFPTTTTVALTSLSTASSPSRHGLVGYRQYLPRFGAVVDMLRMSPHGVAQEDAFVGPAWSPSVVLGAPTIFRDGIRDAVAVSRDRFEGRGFTRMLYDGAQYEPYLGYADFAAALAQVLGRRPPPPLVFAYWDELDTVSHLRGPGSPSVDLELERLHALLGYVARSLGPGAAGATTVLVTADHGLVPAEPERQSAFDADPEVADRLIGPPTGDRRVGFLRARPGQLEPLERAVLATLPKGARSIRAEEAIRGGLFGPPPYHPELLERVGDLVVLVPSPGGITYTLPGRSPSRRGLLGAHGGLEADELVVPLIAARLDRFATESPPAERRR